MPTSTTLYKHVLLATDLSAHSDTVAKRASAIAKMTHAKLSIVHVLTHTAVAYAGEFSIPIDAEFEAALEAQAKKQMAKLGKKYQIAEDAQHLAQGSVKLAVTDLANEIHADLIVVGTHGHEGLNLLLGSQANAILHVAKCDVWVIKI